MAKETTAVRLQVKGHQFVTGTDQPVKIFGIGLGGWMNMENFIVGFPGTETLMRRALEGVIGEEKTERLLSRYLEVFFQEDDAAFLAEMGFNLVRIPVGYRHLETATAPFQAREVGFAQLDRVIDLCARHRLYTIVDLHTVPGWQNYEWHADNPTHHATFWDHSQFQDRVIQLWQVIADRYKDHPWVAGYEPMNEPGDPLHRRARTFFQRLLPAIREADPSRILFLKGNGYPPEFDIFPEPVHNSVFISFDYAIPGAAQGRTYPGETAGQHYDRKVLEKTFLDITQHARQTRTPIWISEFGPVYTGDPTVDEHRYRVLEDQLAVYREHDANWAIWTYKDVGVQGLVQLRAETPWMQRIKPILEKKARLGADAWGTDDSQIRDILDPLEARFNREFPDFNLAPGGSRWWINRLVRHILLAEPMVPQFARRFEGVTDQEVDALADSFSFAGCRPLERLAATLRAEIHTRRGRVPVESTR